MKLEYLASKDSKWKAIAISLCGNVDEANDLIQDFYIRMSSLKPNENKTLNDSYFRRAITNLFFESKRKYVKTPTFVSCDNVLNLCDSLKEFEVDDNEQKYIDRFNEKLTTDEQQLLLSNYDNSMRQVARLNDSEYYNTNRTLSELRVKCLREDYSKMYKNKRNNRR